MLKGLKPLMLKEVKDLIKDPKVWLGMVLAPLLMFPIMGVAVQFAMGAAEKSAENVPMAMLDLDGGPRAQELVAFLRGFPNVTLTELEAVSVEEAVSKAREADIPVLVVIQEGFSENINAGLRGNLEIYSIMSKLDPSEAMKLRAAEAMLSLYENALITVLIGAMPGGDPEFMLNPIAEGHITIYRGKIAKVHPLVLQGIAQSQMMLPFFLSFVLIIAMQISATSMAQEKEQRTLETLLTLPVGRMGILASKLAGTAIVALAATVTYLIGFSYYMGVVMPAAAPAPGVFDLSPSPAGMVLLGALMFLSILAALALAMMLAVLAKDVRGAQSLVGPLFFSIFIPALMLMFTDIDLLPLPVQAVLYAIPFTHTMMGARAVLIGEYLPLTSITYLGFFSLFSLYLAARLFASDKLLTMVSLGFRIGKKRITLA